jgi:hypothetical protein
MMFMVPAALPWSHRLHGFQKASRLEIWSSTVSPGRKSRRGRAGGGKQISALSHDGEDCLHLLYLRYVVLHCSPFAIGRRGRENGVYGDQQAGG